VPAQHSVDLRSEELAVASYRAAVLVATEANDACTRLLLDRILTEEEGHASDLEGELDQLAQMGAGPYLAQQIGG
jgi:bacterioferritin (cytochrome b1)